LDKKLEEGESSMVRIRLRRIGAKEQPSYRIVVADKESPRDGRFLEILGSYNPRTNPSTIQIMEGRVYHWMSQGAQPSESVSKLFRTVGLNDRYELFKKGEAIETLLAEAETAEKARVVDPKTSADFGPKKAKKA
jgi:small subunit ribosomal protein S16